MIPIGCMYPLPDTLAQTKLYDDLSDRCFQMLMWGVTESDIPFINQSINDNRVIIIIEGKPPFIMSFTPDRLVSETLHGMIKSMNKS